MDTDYDSIQHTQSITQKFFTIPSKTDPSILKVINEIKKRNNNKEFITAFVKQHGYPVWNKVLIGKNIKPRYENSFTNAVNDSSIIAYIPYVLEDSTKINGYIVANISDSITLGYRQANEYVNHSFNAPVNEVSDATKFATVMMQLNQLVFGNNEYYITDRRLFGSTTEHIEINKVKLGATEGGVLSQNFAEAEICSTVTTSGWQCGTPNYHGCNDADGCDHCITYCYPVDIISEVCWTFEVGDGGGGETGTGTAPGGNTPGGNAPPGSGGGGSGSGIPPADPCNNTPDNPIDPYTAQSNVVDPGNCPPPTGGPGWVPWEAEPPYICNYQLSQHEQDVFNLIDEEDDQSDFIHQNLDCQGTKRTGNIFFQGTKEHWMIQLDYVSKNPIHGDMEFAIPNSSAAGNRGYADLVNLQDKTIFEIKPNNLNGQSTGASEVANYVNKANQFCSIVGPMGSSWSTGLNYSPAIIPTSAPNKFLKTQLYAPGVIVYSYEITTNPVPAPPIVVPVSVVDKFKHLIDRLRQNFQQANKIIAEFLQQNPELVNYIKGAAVGAGITIIVGTILEDIITAGGGIADDWACFVLSYRIIRYAIAL